MNRFEQPLLKTIFAPTRLKFGIRGKRRKRTKPATHVELSYFSKVPQIGEPPIHTEMIEAARYPFWFIGLIMQPPRYLVPATPDKPHWGVFVGSDRKLMSDLYPSRHPKRRGNIIELPIINAVQYAQLLAKIAYGYIVGAYGYGSFVSLVHPLIYGETSRFEDIVGGDPEVPPPSACGFEILPFEKHLPGLIYVGADIRIWPHAGSPRYTVVVGALRSQFSKATAHGAHIEVSG
jgi:hypothetical protein